MQSTQPPSSPTYFKTVIHSSQCFWFWLQTQHCADHCGLCWGHEGNTSILDSSCATCWSIHLKKKKVKKNVCRSVPEPKFKFTSLSIKLNYQVAPWPVPYLIMKSRHELLLKSYHKKCSLTSTTKRLASRVPGLTTLLCCGWFLCQLLYLRSCSKLSSMC